ncbi:hypothetical protein QYE76_004954 [Lolium multiflorum]|uniref:Uncharacterized protein n=1 Tax=Lolium multiflorum TaxID=4521 RepID=A0AAD8RT30_LOLMU|nr:hypothetical protein QYE76_004954 [Lolium multiflorum]
MDSIRQWRINTWKILLLVPDLMRDEEKNENDDSLVLADYEGEDLPTIEWNREDPQLAEGTVFQTMMDCRSAIISYHILTKNNYEVIKNQAGAANAKENEAAIQLEEIEAAVQHEEIEAAIQHEEIEAAIEHEEIEPMDREQREQMDVEWLRPMSTEEKEEIIEIATTVPLPRLLLTSKSIFKKKKHKLHRRRRTRKRAKGR